MEFLCSVLATALGMFLGGLAFVLFIDVMDRWDGWRRPPLPPAPETESEPPTMLPFNRSRRA